MENILTSPELQVALGNLILVVITAVVGALSGAILRWVKTNTSTAQFNLLQVFATSAVSAAEQGAIAGCQMFSNKCVSSLLLNARRRAKAVAFNS